MKIAITVALILVSTVCYAENFFIELQANTILATNDDVDKQANGSAKLIAGYRWLYLWGSLDQDNSLDWAGQAGPSYQLGAVGVGLRVPVVKHFSLYGEFGRFFFPDQEDGWQRTGTGSWEAIHYNMTSITGQQPPSCNGTFDQYRSHMKDAWGGEVGALAWYPIGYGWSVNGHIGYRFLQVERYAKAEWDDSAKTGQWWQFHDSLDLNAWVVGCGLTFEF